MKEEELIMVKIKKGEINYAHIDFRNSTHSMAINSTNMESV